MIDKIYSITKEAVVELQVKMKEWVKAVMPKKTSELENDKGYITEGISEAEVNALDWREVAVIGGRAYPIVKIGTQTWIAENLDYKFDGCTIGGSASSAEPRGNYYNNDETTYGADGKKYGLLYNWQAIKYLEDNKDTLIPGWHVPTIEDLNTLISYAGGDTVANTKLRTKDGWTVGGTDDYGFGVAPTGYYESGFKGNGIIAYLVTSSIPERTYYLIRGFNASGAISLTGPSLVSGNMYSIRLIKD